jgi:hypothetical protein
MKPKWNIVNWISGYVDREILFWNNDLGWVPFELSDSFVSDDLMNLDLPLEGAWVMEAFAKRVLAGRGDIEND